MYYVLRINVETEGNDADNRPCIDYFFTEDGNTTKNQDLAKRFANSSEAIAWAVQKGITDPVKTERVMK